MHTAILKAAALAVCLVITDIPIASALPVTPFVAADSGFVLVAKKKRKVAHGGRILLGRVEDIDRRERKAKNRHTPRGGKLVGRVPARGRSRDSEAFNGFMLGLAGAALGAATGYTGGSSGGCGIDVTTANPKSCGTRRASNGGSNGLRPPYYCMYEGRKIVSNTFHSGCWMVSQDNTTIPMGR